MSQSPEKILRRLRAAHGRGVTVELRLKQPWKQDPSFGYVLSVGDEWVTVRILFEGFHLDDVVLLRWRDLRSVKRHPNTQFVTRVVDGLGAPAVHVDVAGGSSTSDLLRVVAERAALVCIYYDDHGFQWREVGTIRKVGRTRFELHAIRDDGTWFADSGLRRVKRVTRVEFGGRYLTTLERFTEELPPASVGSVKRMADL